MNMLDTSRIHSEKNNMNSVTNEIRSSHESRMSEWNDSVGISFGESYERYNEIRTQAEAILQPVDSTIDNANRYIEIESKYAKVSNIESAASNVCSLQ
jgi:uncharacterized FlgJ-related protein